MTTYFTEGFPYTIIRSLSSFFLRDMKVSLESIGLTSLFGIPWTVKFLWAPHIDRFGTKRTWLLYTQFLLVMMMLLTALLVPLAWGVPAIMGLFFVGAFIAATHDIAIDGYYLEALDADGQAKFIGYRVMAYRIAMATGSGVVATIGAAVDWYVAFACAAVIFGIFFMYHVVFLPRVEKKQLPIRALIKASLRPDFAVGALLLALGVVGVRYLSESDLYKELQTALPALKSISFSHWVGILLLVILIVAFLFRARIKAMVTKDPESFYSKAFVSFMDREGIGAVLLFIIVFRIGEFMLFAMVTPFFVDLGIKVHYGWLASAVGLPAFIGGAMLGGWMIAKFSLRKVIWPFVLIQNSSILIYMALALFLAPYVAINTGISDPRPIGAMNLFWVACVHGIDQCASGLGTSVLMTVLMRVCLKEFKATHYAIGSGLMSVCGVFAGILSGFLASWLGYGYFFGISFLMSVPGMAVIYFLPEFVLAPKKS